VQQDQGAESTSCVNLKIEFVGTHVSMMENCWVVGICQMQSSNLGLVFPVVLTTGEDKGL
jgi:hypothetical protein